MNNIKYFSSRLFFYLAPLLSYQLYNYNGIPHVINRLCGFGFTTLLLIAVGLNPVVRASSQKTDKILKCILVSILISYVMAFVFWWQSPISSYLGSINYLNLVFFYFYLKKYDIKQHEIITLFFIYSALYIFLTLYGWSVAPNKVFGYVDVYDEDTLNMDRGLARLFLPGSTLLVSTLFYSLSKILMGAKKLIWGGITVVLFLFCCSDLIRFKIMSVVLAAMYFVLKTNKMSFKLLLYFILLILSVSYVIIICFPDVVEGLVLLTQYQFESAGGQDDGFTRYYEYLFFFTEFNNNPITYIFGNGTPRDGEFVRYLFAMKDKGYYNDDVSYSTIFIALGVVGLIQYFRLLYRGATLKMKPKMTFLTAIIIYIAIANITIDPLLDGVAFSIILYLIENNKMTLYSNENTLYHREIKS